MRSGTRGLPSGSRQADACGAMTWGLMSIRVPQCPSPPTSSSAHASRAQVAYALVEKMEGMLSEAHGKGCSKVSVAELSHHYGQLEESNRELEELDVDAVNACRLSALQKGIQRFAALARYS